MPNTVVTGGGVTNATSAIAVAGGRTTWLVTRSVAVFTDTSVRNGTRTDNGSIPCGGAASLLAASGAASLSAAMCATASLGLLSGTDATVTLGGQRGSGVGAKPEAAAKHSEIPTSIVAA